MAFWEVDDEVDWDLAEREGVGRYCLSEDLEVDTEEDEEVAEDPLVEIDTGIVDENTCMKLQSKTVDIRW